jgi:hypothetical protein
MASLKFPDISVSAVEAGKALKKMSEAMAKATKERESKNLIFKIQIVSVFPKWYAFTIDSITTTEEETIQTNWTFTSDSYTKSAIKKRILEFEEQHKAKYQALLKDKYKVMFTYDTIPKTHYILEVNTE